MPISLDTRTLVFAAAVISAAMVPLMYMNTRVRKEVPGWVLWTFSAALLSGSSFLLALRGVVPDAASVMLGNLLAAVGMLVASAGVRLCCGRRGRARWLEAGSAAMYCLEVYLFQRNSPQACLLVHSLILMCIGIYTAVPLLRKAPEGRELGYYFTAGLFLLGFGVPEFIFRFVLRRPPTAAWGDFANSWPNLVYCLSILLFLVGLAYGYFLLTNERLLAALQTSHELLRNETDQLLHTQTQLARAERMEAVGRLAGGISHFFNNQMCIVRLDCEELLDSPETPASMIPSLKRISAAGIRASEITARLMQFARSNELNNRKFDMAQWLQGIAGNLRRALGPSIELTIEGDVANASVFADSDELTGVLMHLAANASDAMPQGGRWTLKLERVWLGESWRNGLGLPSGNYLCLSATDTGCGMDEDTLKRIFEPFYSTRSLAVAEGLGMASAFGLMEQSGGTMTASSKVGAGSTLCLYLPSAASDTE